MKLILKNIVTMSQQFKCDNTELLISTYFIDGSSPSSGITSAEIQKVELIAQRLGKVEHVPGSGDGPVENLGLSATRTDVETHTDNVDVQSASDTQQFRSFGDRIAAELHAQLALGIDGVASYADDHPERKNMSYLKILNITTCPKQGKIKVYLKLVFFFKLYKCQKNWQSNFLYGIPQERVLGPFPFNILINDIKSLQGCDFMNLFDNNALVV